MAAEVVAQRIDNMDSDERVAKARMIERSGGDPDTILGLLEEAAGEGDPEAIYAIGTFYLHGKYYSKDGVRGIDLIRRAAILNWKDAVFDFAVALETGDFIEKNLEQAFKNYLRAMMLGDLSGAEEVCRCLYYGIGTEKNLDLYDEMSEALKTLRIPLTN